MGNLDVGAPAATKVVMPPMGHLPKVTFPVLQQKQVVVEDGIHQIVVLAPIHPLTNLEVVMVVVRWCLKMGAKKGTVLMLVKLKASERGMMVMISQRHEKKSGSGKATVS
jgi:hypothetical protein